MLLGSYLPHTVLVGKELGSYPFPVLTLGGELDGLTGLNYLARESATVRSLAGTDAASRARKPVVVVPGTAHMQFADGSALSGDTIAPEVGLDQAHAAMADVIVDFMAAQIPFSVVSAQTAAQSLTAKVLATEALLEPYVLAADAEEGICADLQRAAVPLAAQAWEQISVATKVYRHGVSDLQFIFDKCSVTQDAGRYALHLPMLIDQPADLADVSNDHFLAPRALWCKMRTADKLAQETGFSPVAPTQNCAQLNAKVIADTLATLKDAGQLRRLTAKYGPVADWVSTSESSDAANEVQFGPFQIRSQRVGTGQKWVAGSFTFAKVADDSWKIDTIELTTGKDVLISLFAGANYCKTLSPGRVIEWATVFGLK